MQVLKFRSKDGGGWQSLGGIWVAHWFLICFIRNKKPTIFCSCRCSTLRTRRRCGGNHSLFEGGELSVGHIAEPFRYRVSRKVEVQGLRLADEIGTTGRP
jgi:hypothetical protein